MGDNKKIRLEREMTQIEIAARAGVSEVSVRMFEANEAAVSRRTRAKLAPVYAALAAVPAEDGSK